MEHSLTHRRPFRDTLAPPAPPTRANYRALLLLVEIMTELDADALDPSIVIGVLRFVEPGAGMEEARIRYFSFRGWISLDGGGNFRVNENKFPGSEEGLPGDAPTHIPDEAAENLASHIRANKRILLPAHFTEPYVPRESRNVMRRQEA